MNLFEIKAEIEALLHDVVDEETGEILGTEMDIEKLEALEMAQDEKRANIAKLYKNAEADETAYKNLKMEYEKKQKRCARLKEWAKSYLEADLQGEAFESADKRVKISYRAVNNKVFVDDISKIPFEYFKQKYDETTLSKTMVKDAILKGESIEGVHLENTRSMSIK